MTTVLIIVIICLHINYPYWVFKVFSEMIKAEGVMEGSCGENLDRFVEETTLTIIIPTKIYSSFGSWMKKVVPFSGSVSK
jgi:hypothetical protein